MKKCFLMIGIFLSVATRLTYSQTHGLISSFYQNQEIVNPASIGMESYPQFYFLQKNYSLHFDGMPVLTLLGGSLPFNYERMAAGVNLMRESAFAVRTIGLNLNYAYRINAGKGRISFGLKMGWIRRSEDLSNVSYRQEEEMSGFYSVNKFSAGGGVTYKDEKYYVGFSMDRSAFTYSSDKGKMVNQYFLTGSFASRLNHAWNLNSTLQFRYLNGFPLLASIALPVYYNKSLLFALSIHSSKTTSAAIGINAAKYISSFNSCWIVYSYDHVVGKLMPVLGNTHELSVKISLGNTERPDKIYKRKTTVSPLYF